MVEVGRILLIIDLLLVQYAMKRPNAVHFTKKNEIKPFEDEEKLEFFSNKNDASLLVIGTHLKKRPHNLTFARMFNHQVLEMFELGVEKMQAMSQIKVRTHSPLNNRRQKLTLLLMLGIKMLGGYEALVGV